MQTKTIIALALVRFALATGPLGMLAAWTTVDERVDVSIYQEASPLTCAHFPVKEATWHCPNPNCDTISHDDFDTCPFCDTPKPNKKK